jgi:hypothetical protein
VRFAQGNRVFAILLAAMPLAAQAPPSERWHLAGTLGMNLTRTTQTSLFSVPTSSPSASYDTAQGDLRMALNGFLENPELLPFSVNFDGAHGSNTVAAGGYRNNVVDWGINTTFLPARPFPLRFFYNSSHLGTSGDTFGQDSDTSTLGVDWTLRLPRVPLFTVGYTRFTNELRLPTSLFQNSYRQGHFYLSAQDSWKGWEWGLGFDKYSNASNFGNASLLPTDFQEDVKAFGARLRHLFWGQKADFRLDQRDEWLSNLFPGQGISDLTTNYTSTTLHLQHTEKLASSYFYNFSRVQQEGTVSTVLLPGLAPNVTLFVLPTFDSNYAGARLDYRVAPFVGLFQELRYQHVTPVSNQFEFRESLSESLSGANFVKGWRGIDVSASYVGHLQYMGTNRSNDSRSFSNEAQGRAAWGDPRVVRLTGTVAYSKLNLVDQLNGFTEDHRYRLEAETRRWNNAAFRLAVERFTAELLNLSGDVNQRGTNFSAQVEHRRFSLAFTRSLGNGFGALFPAFVQLQFRISSPLPLEQLFFTPLLNRTMRASSAVLVLRLRRNLDLSGNWRTERDLLTASHFEFRQVEGRLRYRLGKFTFDTAIGSYRNTSFAGVNFSGLRTNRYLLRVTRDFRVF